jgi:hypothetical protein
MFQMNPAYQFHLLLLVVPLHHHDLKNLKNQNYPRCLMIQYYPKNLMFRWNHLYHWFPMNSHHLLHRLYHWYQTTPLLLHHLRYLL